GVDRLREGARVRLGMVELGYARRLVSIDPDAEGDDAVVDVGSDARGLVSGAQRKAHRGPLPETGVPGRSGWIRPLAAGYGEQGEEQAAGSDTCGERTHDEGPGGRLRGTVDGPRPFPMIIAGG